MKIPFNEQQTLNYIYQEEFDNLSWLDKQLGIRKATIYTTNELAKKYKKLIDEKKLSKTFQPFKFDQILLTIVSIILIWLVVEAVQNTENPNGWVRVIVFLLITTVLGFVVVNFDPTRNLKITLSTVGIAINEFSYPWKEVYQTYIVIRRHDGGHSSYIILALDTGVTHRYEFTGLMPFTSEDKKLSAFIEYYKNFD